MAGDAQRQRITKKIIYCVVRTPVNGFSPRFALDLFHCFVNILLTCEPEIFAELGSNTPTMTREEIDQKMDELARKYVETHDKRIIEEFYQLSCELEKIEKLEKQ
jgi:hypothetical protein